MGVPSLYKWLTQRYPEIKLKLDPDAESNTDNLYLDFNAIIHPCCDKSLENMLETDRCLYNNLMLFLDDIMLRVKPRRLLYIAIDGVAPRAKLNQQRSRRFTHAKEHTESGKCYFKDDCGIAPVHHLQNKSENDKEESNCVFDTNSITPGTEFMQRLDTYLQELIAYKMSTDDLWKSINVIFSGYKVPGEGEHKILEYIKKHQNQKQTCIILSPDADLIFLGMTLFYNDVKILREEPTKSSPVEGPITNSNKVFSLVDIPKLRNLLIREFKGGIKESFDHKRFLEDWIFLCFTVGNDFLPSSPCFEIKTNALDKLTFILQNVYLRTKSFITNKGEINFDILREFFYQCSRKEDDFLVEKRNNLYHSRTRMNLPFDQSQEFYLDDQNGKIKYYIEKMGIKSEAELMEACKEYIKGFVWVYNYYFYENASWDWYYPYHFAPFFSDLALVKNYRPKFSASKPLRPLEQLLTVLPAQSKDLLPAPLHSVFTDFPDYYPSDFKLDMFQKVMDWQAVAILPFIDTSKIVEAFSKKQNDLTFEETERNIPSYPIFYSSQLKIVSKVYPMYTELKTCDKIQIDEYAGKIFTLPSFKPLEEVVDSYGLKYVNRVVKFTFDQRVKSSKKLC